jgi:FkbM family methyltransferase
MSLVRRFFKAVLPPPVTIRLRAAFKHHEPERALLPALCDPARAALDIGAALGAYTWPLARLCNACIAFEANPHQANYLRQALGERVRVESVALSDRDGVVELVIPQGSGSDLAGQATIAPGAWLEGQPVQRVRVPMHTLDGYNLPLAGFIKLDVEGHELAVLQGGRTLLAKERPTILVELEERFDAGSIARVQDFLVPLGYRGLYLNRGQLYDIAGFDPALHQKLEDWGRQGIYINNFVFIAQDNFEAVRQRLRRLGHPVEA